MRGSEARWPLTPAAAEGHRGVSMAPNAGGEARTSSCASHQSYLRTAGLPGRAAATVPAAASSSSSSTRVWQAAAAAGDTLRAMARSCHATPPADLPSSSEASGGR